MADSPNAPAWVQSVTPAEIVRQRQLGWVDFHPEDFCHICGHRNPVWTAPAVDWDVVIDGHGGIFCPSCWATLYESKVGRPVCWWFSVDLIAPSPATEAPQPFDRDQTPDTPEAPPSPDWRCESCQNAGRAGCALCLDGLPPFDPTRLSIGQIVRITTQPPHPASIVGTVRAVVPDPDGRGDFAIEIETQDGGTATAFTSLLDEIEVIR